MRTLKLFNGVLAKKTKVNSVEINTELGYIIEPTALWASDQIERFYKEQHLSGEQLNKTFHKSWKKIKKSSRYELLLEQIRHYASTYGSDFQGEAYIPNEVLELPEEVNLKFKVIHGYSREELVNKCFSLLNSGIALKEETIDNVLSILFEDLNYAFTGDEKISNKEATVKLAEVYNVLPTNPVEFLRYLIYRATGETLLIKNKRLIELIKTSNYNPVPLMNKFGLGRLAEIFNRFKPLFLAFKNDKTKTTINRISKLSKYMHKPMVENPLNNVTNELLTDDDIHWLDNASVYALFKAMNACFTRMQGQEAFVYNIRNGKGWATIDKDQNIAVCYENFGKLIEYLRIRLSSSSKWGDLKLYVPSNIDYALPTSEKMFVGNVPMGTKISGEKLAVGMYWENSWGAHDLDLSGINLRGKIGWNSSYNQGNGSLMYSGDITSAPDGAVEYLYATNGLKDPTLVKINVYNGSSQSGYQIIVGMGDSIDRKYMMNPDNRVFSVKTETIGNNTNIGLFVPSKDGSKQEFYVLNTSVGSGRVSGNNEITMISNDALVQRWTRSLRLSNLFEWLKMDVSFVDDPENADIDLSVDNLERDTFIQLFG